MLKRFTIYILFFVFAVSAVSLCCQTARVQAQEKSGLGENITDKMETIGEPYNPTGVGLKPGERNILAVYQLLIGRFTALLGIMFFCLTVVGGVQWMTAGGNEEKIESAKKRITAGVIGVAIVLSAYIITYFVLSQLSGATGVGTGFN